MAVRVMFYWVLDACNLVDSNNQPEFNECGKKCFGSGVTVTPKSYIFPIFYRTAAYELGTENKSCNEMHDKFNSTHNQLYSE